MSCDASFGEKYTIGNLEIYYTQFVGERYVEGVGEYFRSHNLIQPEKHSVQLTTDNESYILKMVLNSDYKTLPEEQDNNLKLLEEDIRNTVFDTLNFRIQVCDLNFNPIKN